jgi:hypothetical protein
MSQNMENMNIAEKADYYCLGVAEIIARINRNWDLLRAEENPLCAILASADPDQADLTRPRITRVEILATRARMIEEIEATQ